MSATAEPQSLQSMWDQTSAEVVELNATGRIVDYLDSSKTRPDTKEERVRQGYARVLHEEYHYPKELMALEAEINIGSESRFADIRLIAE